MLRRFASVLAGGAMALTSYGVMTAAPAAADPPTKHEIVVTKVVEGEHKGVGYEVVVDCQKVENNVDPVEAQFGEGNDFPQTLVFPPGGGTQTVEVKVFRSGKHCTIVETHSGGASHVTVEPSECNFPGKHQVEAVEAVDGEDCHVTITNTFKKPEPQVGPAGPPGPAVAAQAVTAVARFTG
jgi:hypothetical protein